MQARWLERNFVPLRRNVRGLEVRRLSAFARALQIASTLRQPNDGESGFGPECTLESIDGKVKGRLDVVYPSEDGVVIRDYKTGAILEEDENGVEEIKSDYVIQLKLYAALYAERHCVWPSRLELCGLDDKLHPVLFSQAECVKTLQDAKDLLSETNNQITSIRSGQMSLTVLANPSHAACRFCGYRPICPAYRSTTIANPGDGQTQFCDIWGVVKGTSKSRLGLLNLSLSNARGEPPLITIEGFDPSPDRNPALAILMAGKRAGVFNVRRTQSPEKFKAGDYTVVYSEDAWPPPEEH
jgi:hypothetical protein